ncbi:unnamed protein product [Arctia plantaginis]|uniref:Uncharacterized protein n=1 Tax=Arctia plantaginis TaxID=874455 RepID=A0A8S1B0A0_ARCPL|nr:unnamed protein product [Arctia plantaginis]
MIFLFATGVMDPSPRPPHPNRGRLHVYFRSAFPGDAFGADGRLDAAYQVGPAAGRRGLRVSSLHAARALILRHAACCRIYIKLLLTWSAARSVRIETGDREGRGEAQSLRECFSGAVVTSQRRLCRISRVDTVCDALNEQIAPRGEVR